MNLIHGRVNNNLHLTTRPFYHQGINRGRLAQSKMDDRIHRRKIAAVREVLIHLHLFVMI